VSSFAEVYEAQVYRVYAFVAYRVPTRSEAEDLTQLTFEKALRAWPRFDPRRASVATWLLAIARNVVIDRHRAAHSEARLDDIPEDRLPIDPGTDGVAGGGDLVTALQTLSERDQEIVGLRFGADMTGPEIAALTGLTLANVQQILSRSLRRLRAELEGSAQRPGAAEPEQRHEQQQQARAEAAGDREA
jgi:RNA polymerase sigma-70 factor (ECF subfamily)